MRKAELRNGDFQSESTIVRVFFNLFFMKNAHVTDELVRLFGWYYTPGNRLLARNKFTWKFLKAELLQPLMLLRAYGISSFLRGLTTFSFVQLFWLKRVSATRQDTSPLLSHMTYAPEITWSTIGLCSPCPAIRSGFQTFCYNVNKSRESQKFGIISKEQKIVEERASRSARREVSKW